MKLFGVEFEYKTRDCTVVVVAITIIIGLLALGFGLVTARTVPYEDIQLPTVARVENSTLYETTYQRAVQLLTQYPVVDGHNDFPLTIRDIYQNDLSTLNFDSNLTENKLFSDYPMCHTDLPKLRKGKVGGQFWSAYMGCDSQYKDAVQLFIEQIDVIKRLVVEYPNDLQFVTDAAGLENAFKNNKIGSMIGVESGHGIGSSLAVLRMIYELGARYMTLTHSCNTPWADSANSETTLPVRNNGLSEFGRDIVKEMNRIGMLVDLAHVSSKTMSDALDVTRAPVMFSHSAARGVYDHERNVPDDILLRVKENGGVVMVNFYSCYVTDCQKNVATVEDVANHINYIRDLIGVDYVGVGGDYNGVESTPVGLEDVSKYPVLFALLLEQNWTEADLGKVASGNILRVWKEVEKTRDDLKTEKPYQMWIPQEDLKNDTYCMSEITK